ncbi:MAG: hypothetical protein HY683_01055 [Chloroflexi bacterium]|nr:hypothetical protein [Chloroflexota bacterium]
MAILSLAAASALLAVACNEEEPSEPALPAGFLEAPLPNVDLGTYLYFDFQEAAELPLAQFAREPALVPPAAPNMVSLASAQVWLGTAPDLLAAKVTLDDPDSAQWVEQALAAGGGEGPLHQREGQDMWLFPRDSQWVRDLQGSLADGTRVQERYPEAWDVLQWLPSQPPGKPVAAGFAFLEEPLLDALLSQTGLEVGGIGQALVTAQIRVVALALYSERPVQLDERSKLQGAEVLDHAGLSVVLVARSGLPRVMLSTMFSTFASQAGLEPVQVEGMEAYSLEQALSDGRAVHLMARRRGNLIYLAVAPSQQAAEAALRSTPP